MRFERTAGGLRVVALALAMVCLLPAAAAFGQPANDSFSAPFTLNGLPASATGSNVDATTEPGEPGHAGRPSEHSVWWAWTAPTTGAVSIDTCGSDFDTVLAVYTGSAVGGLTPVAGNDDACSSESSVTFNAQAGQVYRIAVGGSFDETGTISLALAPTLTVRTTTVKRRHKIDATRIFIEAATAGDDLPDVPTLRFQRGKTRVTPDLDIDNEIDSGDDTRFQYTFNWSCARAGAWSWTVSAVRSGTRASQQGTFTVPRCVTRPWFVSKTTVVRGFAADFGRQTARYLRCRPSGARRGSRAASWRCGLARRGFVCRGGFRFRYSRTYQAGDLVASKRAASGSVTCRG